MVAGFDSRFRPHTNTPLDLLACGCRVKTRIKPITSLITPIAGHNADTLRIHSLTPHALTHCHTAHRMSHSD